RNGRTYSPVACLAYRAFPARFDLAGQDRVVRPGFPLALAGANRNDGGRDDGAGVGLANRAFRVAPDKTRRLHLAARPCRTSFQPSNALGWGNGGAVCI